MVDPGGVAEKIGGHAWAIRERQFKDKFGEDYTEEDLVNLVQGILTGESDVTKPGPDGQTAYWDQDNDIIVIYNPNDEEKGIDISTARS